MHKPAGRVNQASSQQRVAQLATIAITTFSVTVSTGLYNNHVNIQLATAAAAGDLPRVRQLLGAGAGINNRFGVNGASPLQEAAGHGHDAVMAYLIRKGARLNQISMTSETALSAAIFHDKVSCAHLLIQHGADVNQRTAGGMSALLLAARHGRAVLVPELLAHGADLTARDAEGRSVLEEAKLGLRFPSHTADRRRTLADLERAISSAAGRPAVRG